jgi:hypothetical protein
MATFSDFLENELLDHVWGNAAYSAPATIYVGLSTADPTDTGSGIAEPSGGAYARVAVTNNATNWPAASGGAKANGTAVTFPKATASWGTIAYMIYMDAVSGGNMLAYAPLTVSKVVSADDTLTFPIGDLDITLD